MKIRVYMVRGKDVNASMVFHNGKLNKCTPVLSRWVQVKMKEERAVSKLKNLGWNFEVTLVKDIGK